MTWSPTITRFYASHIHELKINKFRNPFSRVAVRRNNATSWITMFVNFEENIKTPRLGFRLYLSLFRTLGTAHLPSAFERNVIKEHSLHNDDRIELWSTIMPCGRHFPIWRCFRLALFRVFYTFKGIKPFIFARDPILFWHLFEKATKYLKHIKFVEKVKYSNL